MYVSGTRGRKTNTRSPLPIPSAASALAKRFEARIKSAKV